MSIKEIYKKLLLSYGRQNWWPFDEDYHKERATDPRVEIIAGAVLTQNTSWKNVEVALEKMKEMKLMSVESIVRASEEKIRRAVKSSGFYNQKARRLKNLFSFIKKSGGLDALFSLETEKLRSVLLSLKGVGKETADSIILYAAGKPVFVVDAYTKRIFSRLGVASEGDDYEEIRSMVESSIRGVEHFKEFHALLVEHAKRFCRKVPKCSECILKSECDFAKNEEFTVK